MEMPENAQLIFEWEYADQSTSFQGERLYKLPNGQYAREQWTQNKVSDWVPCSPGWVLQLLVQLEKEGYFPEDRCPICGASNGPIWPGDTHGKYRIGHVCCSCMCA